MEILEIAKYEFLLLIRSMRFKIMTVFYIVIIGLLNVGIAFFNRNGMSPMITSISSFAPYLSFYLFSFISAITIPFIIGNFLIDDKKGRVDGVIYSKPTSSLRYIIGKFIGSVSTLITIALIIMFISSVIQITIAVRPYRIIPYITSFLLICLPTIIFLSGLVFVLNFILKNRLIVFLIVVGFSIFSIFIIGEKWLRLLDFPAMTLPLNPSDIMGYGNINNEIIQRTAYIFTGLSLVLLSSVFPYRLTERKFLSLKMLAVYTATVLVPAFLFIFIVNKISNGEQVRRYTLTAQDKYSEFPLVKIDHYDMNIELFPSKHSLKADVRMDLSVQRENNLDKAVFLLNSGLKITKLTDENNNDIPYEREYSILAVDFENSSSPPKQINISYEGEINENSFYLLDKRKGKKFLDFAGLKAEEIRWNFGECSSWLGRGCIFLIPESKWYPVPGVDYKENIRISKESNFATSEISVTVPEKYKAVTQGSLINTEKEKNKAVYIYKSDNPVPQFSINAGEYIVKHIEVDSIDFYAYYSSVHRKYAEFFADSTVLQDGIKELKDWITEETLLNYPYSSFSLVEIPLDFRAYNETYEDFNPMVQPGVIMIYENNINLAEVQYLPFYRSSENQAKQRGDFFDSYNRKKGYFKKYIASNLAFSGRFGGINRSMGDWGSNLLNVITEYWGFQIGSKDRQSSLIRKGINRQIPFLLGGQNDAVFFYDKSELYDAVEEKPLIEFSPEEDDILYDRAMQLKCPAIMNSLCYEIGEDKYKEIISGFLEKYRYKNPSIEDFKIFAEETSGKNLDSFFEQWLETPLLAGYTITKAEAYPLITKEIKIQYQMKVRVRNWEEGHGNIRVRFRTEKDNIERYVPFESFEEKEIGVVVPDKPRSVEVNTIFSKNWTSPRFIYTLPEKPMNATPFDGAKTVEPEESEEIIVDDQDEGFSIVNLKKDRFRIFGQEENGSNIREGVDGASLSMDRIGNWTRFYHWLSFGKFRNSMIVKNKGKGNTYAVWKTIIPEDDFYETYIFINNYTRNTQFVAERIGSVFYITVVHSASEENVEIKTSRDMDGWHYLGAFEYNKGDTAEIRLSDKCDGAVIADAVKWVPAD